MRKYNEFSALWRAVRPQGDFFQDVALRWKGIGVRYMMLLLVLAWLAVFIRFTFDLTDVINHEAPADLKDFPTMVVKAGHVSSAVAQPYIYSIDKKPVFVLDTTGQVKRPSERGASFLITETGLVQEDSGVTKTQSFAALPDMTVDQAKVMEWLRGMRNFAIPVGVPAAWVISGIYRVLCALAFAGLGLAFAGAIGVRLSYASLVRLSMVCMTPAIVIDTVLGIFSVGFGLWAWIVFPPITVAYLVYAIRAVARVAPGDSGGLGEPSQIVAPRTVQDGGDETDQLFP